MTSPCGMAAHSLVRAAGSFCWACGGGSCSNTYTYTTNPTGFHVKVAGSYTVVMSFSSRSWEHEKAICRWALSCRIASAGLMPRRVGSTAASRIHDLDNSLETTLHSTIVCLCQNNEARGSSATFSPMRYEPEWGWTQDASLRDTHTSPLCLCNWLDRNHH